VNAVLHDARECRYSGDACQDQSAYLLTTLSDTRDAPSGFEAASGGRALSLQARKARSALVSLSHGSGIVLLS